MHDINIIRKNKSAFVKSIVFISIFLQCINKFIAVRESKFILLRVNKYTLNSESWKIPTIDLLFAGLIILFFTAASNFNSISD